MMDDLSDSVVLTMADGKERRVSCCSFGRFAVHESADPEPDPRIRWDVTHIPTGLGVLGAPSMEAAIQAAKRLEDYERTGLRIEKSSVATVRALCGGLLVWVFNGGWCYGSHDIPDITAWAREVA